MLQKVLWWGSVVIAAVGAFELGPVASNGLVLVLIGIVSGFMYPIEDVTTRVGYYVLAVWLPPSADIGGERGVPNDGVLASSIPVLGPALVGFLVHLTFVIAGVAISSVLLSVYNGLMAAGND